MPTKPIKGTPYRRSDVYYRQLGTLAYIANDIGGYLKTQSSRNYRPQPSKSDTFSIYEPFSLPQVSRCGSRNSHHTTPNRRNNHARLEWPTLQTATVSHPEVPSASCQCTRSNPEFAGADGFGAHPNPITFFFTTTQLGLANSKCGPG